MPFTDLVLQEGVPTKMKDILKAVREGRAKKLGSLARATAKMKKFVRGRTKHEK